LAKSTKYFIPFKVVIWDIEEFLGQLKNRTCIWDHKVILEQQTEKLHIQV
jgi:hypothetical protein